VSGPNTTPHLQHIQQQLGSATWLERAAVHTVTPKSTIHLVLSVPGRPAPLSPIPLGPGRASAPSPNPSYRHWLDFSQLESG